LPCKSFFRGLSEFAEIAFARWYQQPRDGVVPARNGVLERAAGRPVFVFCGWPL